MSESAFSNFSITDDDADAEATEVISPSDLTPRPGLFTILYDSLEQKPYTFSNIIGDAKDDHAPILVKTVKKRLKVADYSILGLESIAIERKSKEDLFSSVANGQKRENFIERLRKMQSTLRFGAVVIEAYKQDIFDNPPIHTSLNPKTVYRSTLSWAIQFPLIHWMWARDRDEAEQITYRLLEKYWHHETSTKYVSHNKPISNHMDAFKLGVIARMSANEFEAPYCREHELRLPFNEGWDFHSNHFLSGDRGVIYEKGETPPSEIATALIAYKGKKGKVTPEDGKQRKPLAGQKSFIESDDELGDMFDNPQKLVKKKSK